ncbi:hypothetical protein [Maribacter ulvicola]|uniref:Uncharacterized protein n=1 Tax=Maribacter ulvicola TaxID=228959 RepID=A0A1N6Z3A7_9FLAO|nr:hypothetical protein [Maribacter ulvicola]SIR21259.1 hypothetical protein SAMN05421797_1088 [Maribacter ulvicola]
MARRIYSIIIVVALALGYYLFSIRDTHSKVYLITVSAIIFTLFSMGIHGLLAHSLKPKVKGDIIIYPLLMGVLWGVLFFLFVFVFLPILCPDFLLKI